MGLHLADYFVTEAGFGSELGAEKFFDIVCRTGNLIPDAVVLVVSIKALKRHGAGTDRTALLKGFVNLEKHLENIAWFQIPVIVAINQFPDDTNDEFD